MISSPTSFSASSRLALQLLSPLALLLIQPNIVSSYSFVPNTFQRQSLFRSYGNNALQTPPTSTIKNNSCCSGNNDLITMKVSKGKSKHSKANSLQTINRTRNRLAGKAGTKHFMDPNKVFIGNLAYDVTEDDLRGFFRQNLGGSLHNVESVKIISDWKTGKSKGFGFIQFMEPMYATSAMESIKGKKLKGRVVRLDQGRKKDDIENRQLFVKKRNREKEVEDEDKVINDALDEAEGIQGQKEAKYTLDDFDDEDDALFDDDEDEEDDEDDDGIDGIFEEIYGTSKWEELDEEEAKNMNREERREAAKRRPRKKLPHKGFG